MPIARVLLIALAVVVLGACSASQTTPPGAATPAGEMTAATAPAADGAYPGPAADGAYPGPAADGAYPGPAAELEPAVSMEPIIVPQPSSNQVGVVHGVLFQSKEGGERVPVTGHTVYLGRILTSTEGVEGLVELDTTVAPKASLNGLGQFVFVDVPPGRYGLMIDTGIKGGQLLLNDPVDGGDFIVEVTGGDTDDLGELAYPFVEI